MTMAMAALAAVSALAHAAPGLPNITGLAFAAEGDGLLIASRGGLAVYRSGSVPSRIGPAHEISGFAATASALFASGRPAPGAQLADPVGLIRTAFGMQQWQPLALEGEARFRLIAAGFHTNAVYVLADEPNEAMSSPGLYLTRDEGRTWRRAAAAGLRGHVLGAAAHPRNADGVALATAAGLFVSHDGGQRFRRIVDGEAVTAVAFDLEGERLHFVTAEANELESVSTRGGARAAAPLPALGIDIVRHLAQSPVEARTLAFATERRNVFLTEDAGTTWRQIVRLGGPP